MPRESDTLNRKYVRCAVFGELNQDYFGQGIFNIIFIYDVLIVLFDSDTGNSRFAAKIIVTLW